MKKMDWTRKLTSRNFGLSIASFAAVLLAALGHKRGGCGADRFPDHGRSMCSGYVIGVGLADARIQAEMRRTRAMAEKYIVM